MSNFDRCKNCGEWGFLDKHECKPEWRAYIKEFDWPMERVFGRDAEQAAENAVAKYDRSGEFTVCHEHETVTVQVQQGNDRPVEVEVTGEMVPNYNATVI